MLASVLYLTCGPGQGVRPAWPTDPLSPGPSAWADAALSAPKHLRCHCAASEKELQKVGPCEKLHVPCPQVSEVSRQHDN